jgi:hypothetical protein
VNSLMERPSAYLEWENSRGLASAHSRPFLVHISWQQHQQQHYTTTATTTTTWKWSQASDPPVKRRPQGLIASALIFPVWAAQLCNQRAVSPGPAACQQCTRPSLVPAQMRLEGVWAARQVTEDLTVGSLSSGDCRGISSAAGAESQSSWGAGLVGRAAEEGRNGCVAGQVKSMCV